MENKNLKKILEFDVVVPEIQREYVWGNNEKVISQFTNEVKNKVDMKIGFVYSYKPYDNMNEIFLIDGQQRITTLVLMAFYCAVNEGKIDEFKQTMKLNESKPAFSYRVRTCTKEFLLELFKNVDKLDDLNKIEQQKWYLSRYEADTSIKSMINALKIIDKKLKDSIDLYDFILEKVEFWYFNVGVTSQGEELYITMNSRGVALSDAEKIKPLLFAQVESAKLKQKYGKMWDQIEEYFYIQKPSTKEIKVIDTMMDRFIQLILQIENQTEKYVGRDSNNRFSDEEIQKLDLEKIEHYFEALKLVERHFQEKKSISLLTCFYEDSQEAKYLYPLASLLRVCYLIVKKEIIEKSSTEQSIVLSDEQLGELKRLYEVIRNAVRRGTINYVPLLKFLSIYNGESVYNFFLNYHRDYSSKEAAVLSPHELTKIKIIFNSESVSDTEKAFWEAQDSLSYLLSGSLKPLIEPFQDNERWTKETLQNFNERKSIIVELFSKQIIEKKLSSIHIKDKIDNALISRAMLVYGDFSINTGSDNWCFGYDSYWSRIFKTNRAIKVLTELISKLTENTENESLYLKLNSVINNYINNFDHETKTSQYYFIKYQNTYLAVNDGYNVMTFWGGWSDYRIEVLNKERLSSYHVNPFCTAVNYYLESKYQNFGRCTSGDAHSGFWFKNGLFLTTGIQHAWIVTTKNNEKLHINIETESLIWDEDKKFYIYTVDLKDDLIEKGVELAIKIHGID